MIDAKGKADEMQAMRESKEVTLEDFSAEEIGNLWSATDTAELEGALEAMGIPAAMQSVSDFRGVIAEAFSTKGQLSALYYSIFNSPDKKILLWLTIAVVAIPAIGLFIYGFFSDNGLLTGLVAAIAEFTAIISGLAFVIGRALNRVKAGMDLVKKFNSKLIKALAAKRSAKSADEKELLAKIAEWGKGNCRIGNAKQGGCPSAAKSTR